MKKTLIQLTAIMLSVSMLTMYAGAEELQTDSEPVIPADDNLLISEEPDNADAEASASVTEEPDITAADTEITDTGARDEELRRSIEEKTQSAIAASNGVDSFAVELTDEEMDYIDSVIAGTDSDGTRRVNEPINLGGSLSEYANDYFLNQMTADEKALYISLFDACQTFAQSNVECTEDYINTYANYNPSSISADRLNRIYNMFYYSNPQFYFLRNGYSYNTYRGTCLPHIYADFESASLRSEFSSVITSVSGSWIAEAKKAKTDLAKQKVIYKSICSNTTYVADSLYDQSAASVFVTGESVCNGYALAAEYLCNAVGIDCIVAVGQGHAWNIVNIDGVWYEFDVTWMDTDRNDRVNLKWRNKSYATFLANDSNNYHKYKSEKYDYFTLPECNVDMVLEDEYYTIDSTGKLYKYTGTQSDVVIPDDLGIETVYYGAFNDNSFVTSVVIPEGISGIGDAAFRSSTALNYVEIPLSVTSIGIQSFYKSSISDIYYAGTSADWNNVTKGSYAIPSNCVIHYSSHAPRSGIEISEINFPDRVFRTFVSDNFDINSDDLLSDGEIAAATSININYDNIISPEYHTSKISSLKGIEYFTELTNLDLTGNSVSELDLSQNTALEKLNCSFNSLTSIDLKNNAALKQLNCGFNALISLDIEKNTALTSLDCSGNIFNIGEVRDTFSLSELSGFDPTKASGWMGAVYDADNNTIKNISGNTINYKYNCGNGFTKTFTLYCSRILPQPVSITVTAPTKTSYYVGEELDLTGGSVTVNYDYGEPAVSDLSSDMISGYDKTKAAKQTITVTYEGFTATFEVTVNKRAATPPVVTAVSGNGQVTLSWDKIEDATKYAVSIYENGKYTVLNQKIKTTSYTAAGLTNGTEYQFLVQSYNGKWSSSSTKYLISATPISTAPVATATAEDGQVTLKWEAVPGATKYAVSTYDNGKYTVLTKTLAGTTYTAKNLTNGKEYQFLVQSYIGKWSSASTDLLVSAIPVSSKPTVTVAAGDGQVTLSWNAVEGATKYAVSTYENGKYTVLSKTITGTTYTAKNLTNGKEYQFLVQSYNGKWSSASTDLLVSATPVSSKPTVTVTAGDGQVALSWNAVTGATKYAVSIYENGKYTVLTKTLAGTTYTAKNLTNGKEYQFLVQSYIGKWSSASTDLLVAATPVSSKLTVTVTAGDGQVALSWNAVTGTTKYAVSIYENGKYTVLTKTLTGTTYTAKNLTNGKEYQFLVQSYNGKWSSASTDLLVSATPVSTSPVVTTTAGNGQVTLKWNAVNGATKYAVSIYENGKYTVLTKTLTGTTYTAKNLTNGKAYQFLVQSYNGKWSSASTDLLISATPEDVKSDTTKKSFVTSKD